MIHKKISVLLGTMALTTMVYAQQTPTGTPGNSSDWRRGGNLAAPPGSGGTNNIFGTLWNSPIYTVTNGVNHMKLNGNVSYSVGSIPGVRNGFLLLTNNPTIWTADGGLMNTQTPVFKTPKQQLTY